MDNHIVPLIDLTWEDSDKEDQDDDDAAIKKAINRAVRAEGEKKSLQEIIASIIVEQSAITFPLPFTTKKAPKKSPTTTLKVSNKRKGHEPLEVLQYQKNQSQKEQSAVCPNLKKLLELCKQVQAKGKSKSQKLHNQVHRERVSEVEARRNKPAQWVLKQCLQQQESIPCLIKFIFAISEIVFNYFVLLVFYKF